jgi:hypothetical protein
VRVQTQATPSITVGQVAGTLTLILLVWGLFRTVIRPHWDSAVFAVFERHPARFKETVRKLFEKEIDERARAIAHVTDMAEGNVEKIKIAESLLSTHSIMLEAVPRLDKVLGEVNLTLRALGKTLDKLVDDVHVQAQDVAHVRGRMDTVYPGPERRHSRRRANDPDAMEQD